jgi:8-amino-7-oxononanoate synthase
MKDLHQRLTSKLQQRKQEGNLRTLQSYSGFTDFFSNDYLGFGNSIDFEVNHFKNAGSSRLIAGTTDLHLKLEEYCSRIFHGEKALLFNSGYLANSGVLSSIPQKDDIILYDERSHASIKDGIRLSLAKGVKFKNNDLSDLNNKINNYSSSTVFVIVESLYSMDGDFAPLSKIIEICEKHGAYLIVDEAHSGGVFGENGSGYCSELNIQPFLKIITFGKAFGAHGACVVGDSLTIDYLINFSRPFIYTTALSTSNANLILQQLKRTDFKVQQDKLQSIITYFNKKFIGFNIESNVKSPIKSIVFQNRAALKVLETELHKDKIGVKAIYAPTVPENQERMRISLHAFNTFEEIDKLYAALKKHEVN